jgi:RNA polymerase sigma-70 factor (ECF subfamily)
MKPRTNTEWINTLSGSGSDQAAALADLRTYLLRAALFTLHRHRGRLEHLGARQVEQLAEEAAQEALVSLLQHLKDFRGDSRFTTWAYTFAVNTALVAARRERWKHVPLDTVVDSPLALPGDPQHHALQSEALSVIRECIEQLTVKQRQALKALVFEEVPLDELARHWATNRNALYKLLHDARRKLRAHLQGRGFEIQELLDRFGAQR